MSAAADFLERLGAGSESIPAERIAVVVAHPDDETIGVGGQLHRLPGITIVHVTDGAPRNLADAREQGFAGWEDYAAARRRELAAAMAEVGVVPTQLVALGLPDQGAALQLRPLAERLAALFEERGIEVVLTHPYEGGHPDHDATAFAVHAAATEIVEMAFYNADGFQRFIGPAAVEIALRGEALARKRRMLAAHRTQQRSLAKFTDPVERFRLAPDYDFSVLPNGGQLHYEKYDWGMTGARWLALTAEAL